MSPWQTPNFSASTLADQMTNFTTQWQQACQKWQSGVEGASTTPAAFWQSVSSIQSAQARFVSEFFQRQPQHFATLFQCKSFPEFIECISRWNGHNLTAAINLGVVMQAHRSSFVQQWQRQFPLTANATALANMWKSGLNNAQSNNQASNFANQFASTFANAFTSNSSTAANTASSSKTASNTPTAGTVSAATSYTQQTSTTQQSSNQNSSIAQATTSPTQTAQAQTAQIIAAPSIASHTALTQPETTEQLTLLNGTNGSAVISSTANSVMRSSTGSTIAAAAAARRSVVARRTANNRRRAPR